MYRHLLSTALLTLLLAVGCAPPSGLLIAPGGQAPELTAAKWLGGEPDTDGKIVVVDVFATWCPPCQKATPELVKIHEEFHAQGVEFVALTNEERGDTELVQRFIDHYDVPWPVGVEAGDTIDRLGVRLIPTVIVVGPDGKVISVGDDKNQLRSTLSKALAYSRKDA